MSRETLNPVLSAARGTVAAFGGSGRARAFAAITRSALAWCWRYAQGHRMLEADVRFGVIARYARDMDAHKPALWTMTTTTAPLPCWHCHRRIAVGKKRLGFGPLGLPWVCGWPCAEAMTQKLFHVKRI